MTKSIWKFPVLDHVTMPEKAEILHVGTQNNTIYIWAICDPKNNLEVRYFNIIGTGMPRYQFETTNYLGTTMVCDGEFVFHVFEQL